MGRNLGESIHTEKTMGIQLRRIILFTSNMPRLTAFYRDVLALPVVADEPGFVQFDAGGCTIALHNGASAVGTRPPKLVFGSADVAQTRADLAARGAKLGKVLSKDGLDRCEGKDPDGNPYSISNRA